MPFVTSQKGASLTHYERHATFRRNWTSNEKWNVAAEVPFIHHVDAPHLRHPFFPPPCCDDFLPDNSRAPVTSVRARKVRKESRSLGRRRVPSLLILDQFPQARQVLLLLAGTERMHSHAEEDAPSFSLTMGAETFGQTADRDNYSFI